MLWKQKKMDKVIFHHNILNIENTTSNGNHRLESKCVFIKSHTYVIPWIKLKKWRRVFEYATDNTDYFDTN